MTLNRRQILALLAATAGLPSSHAEGIEQTRILYGFPPGSSGDVAARRIAERLGGSTYAKNAPLVDNRAGAGGRLALEALKTMPADGSVLALTPMVTTAIYPHVYRRLAYDPVADLSPVGMAAVSHHGLAVGPAVPASVTNVKSFLAWAKANPDSANYGSPAAGSTPHFLGALLALGQDVPLRHVPYRGSMPGITDLVGGQIAAMFTPTGDFLNFQRAGKLRLLATSGPSRLPFASEVPTFAEQGLGELTVEEWYASMPARAARLPCWPRPTRDPGRVEDTQRHRRAGQRGPAGQGFDTGAAGTQPARGVRALGAADQAHRLHGGQLNDCPARDLVDGHAPAAQRAGG